MNILFVTSSRIGDAVLSTGVLDYLISEYPDARITIACGPVAAPPFEAVPNLSRIIVMEKKAFALHWLKLWAAGAVAALTGACRVNPPRQAEAFGRGPSARVRARAARARPGGRPIP